MRTKILTLRYSPQLGGFDDGPLVSLQQKVVLQQVREHVMQIGGEPMLVCIAEWREQSQHAVSPAARTEPTGPGTRPDAEPSSAPPAAPGMPEPNHAPITPATVRTTGPARPVGELRAELTAEQRQRFDRLRAWRSTTAQDEGAPPYVILTNRQLVELVLQRPNSKAGIGRIDGLGEKKVARHGEAILRLLWSDGPGTPSSMVSQDAGIAAAEAVTVAPEPTGASTQPAHEAAAS